MLDSSVQSAAGFLRAAMKQHQAGDLAEAERLYRELLHVCPDHAEGLHLLGILLGRSGRIEEGIRSIEAAAALEPAQPAFQNNLGEMYRQQGRLAEALACLERAVCLAPQLAEAYFNLGNVHRDLGEHARAIQSYQQAVRLRPSYPKARYNLANVLREEGRVKEAIQEYRNALADRRVWHEAHLNLGNAYAELRDTESAILHYQQAMATAPADVDVDENLGGVHLMRGDVATAREHYGRSQARRPDRWLRRLRLESLCEPIPPSMDYVVEYRGKVEQLLLALREEPRAIDLSDLHTSAVEPPMPLAYHGQDDLPLKRLYGGLFLDRIPVARPKRPSGPPHVGIVVTRSHEGVFARCLGGIAERLSRKELRISIVCSRSGANVLPRLLKAPELEYLAIPDRVDQAADMLCEVGFDLLHYWEVGTDSVNYFLPFFGCAARQSATWGWPVTTGNPRIDYFLSSRLLEPQGAQSHYAEKLVLMETLPAYYERPTVDSASGSRASFGLGQSDHVYLCTQNLRKYQPDFDLVLAEILRGDGQGRLLLISDEQPAITDRFLRRLRAAMPDVKDRVRIMPRLDRAEYLKLVAAADVVLDTFHYGGGANTVYDAIAVGTPLATLCGTYHRGRYATATLVQLGLNELVAQSPEEYVALSLKLGTDRDYREAVSRRLLRAAEALFEDERVVLEHERFFSRACQEGRDSIMKPSS